jgi:4-amino-4-deoxy-L-arabinose transferase-like glycosyltransferase
MQSRPACYPWIVLVVAAICLLGSLGGTRFWDEDEGFFASTAKEMFSASDWVVPKFNGEVFGHKPPWMYWMMMAGFSAFGVNEFSARLPGALFGIATALLTYRLGAQMFSRRVGLIAGVALPSCFMFGLVARAATPDVYLAFFTTLALYLFVTHGYLKSTPEGDEPIQAAGELRPSSWWVWCGIYLILGLAVLVKGPIGFLFPMAVIGLFLLCQPENGTSQTPAIGWAHYANLLRRFGLPNFFRTLWSMRPLTAVAMILLVAGPWYFAVDVATDGKFLSEFFGTHHFQRFTSSMDNHHGPFFYYFLSILAGGFPWTIFTFPVIIEWRQQFKLREADRRGLVLLACWIGVYVGIFTLASTKLSNYILPVYPALAILCGLFIERACFHTVRRHRLGLQAAYIACIIIGLLTLTGMQVAARWKFDGQTLFDRCGMCDLLQADARWIGLIGLPLMISGGIALMLVRREKIGSSVLVAVATMLLVIGTVWNVIVPRIDRFQSPQTFAQLVGAENRNGAKVPLCAYRFFRPSMVFYSGQSVKKVDTPDALEALIATGDPLFVVTIDEGYHEIEGFDLELVERRPRFLRTGHIYLLQAKTVDPGLAHKSGNGK